jgi:hypothetical protein
VPGFRTRLRHRGDGLHEDPRRADPIPPDRLPLKPMASVPIPNACTFLRGRPLFRPSLV